jgi:hypothetical protein
MSPSTGGFDVAILLRDRGMDLVAFGGAYLVLLATLLVTAGAFFAVRHYLVLSPNRWARDYGLYVSLVLATLVIAIVLENELLPRRAATLHYVAIPQLLLLLGAHLAITYRPDPWLVALGGAATVATGVVALLGSPFAHLLRPAYVVTWLMLSVLLVFLWRKSVSTKRGFATASIYIGSKETLEQAVGAQAPWLGWPQWVALVVASVALALCNSLLRGTGLEQVPALDVATGSALQMLVTAVVCAVPASYYWLARRKWMPELTRFVWLAWLVVGFAFTYGNYLTSLGPA